MGYDSSLPEKRKGKRGEAAGELLPAGLLRAGLALMVIATGLVFLLAETNVIDWGAPWWTIYIAIPGAIMLWAAARVAQRTGKPGRRSILLGGLGIIALILAAVFVFDPTWSFTRRWTIFSDWPVFQAINWNAVWKWALVLLGTAFLVVGERSRSLGTGILGAAVLVVGLVFMFDISWNLVWPLAIVAVGVGMLLYGRSRNG